MTYSNLFHQYLANVELLAANGVPAPPEWVALRQRFADYIELAHPLNDRLAAEILEPTGADVAVLQALSLAEQAATSVDDAAVTDVVRSRVHGRLAALYEPVAAAHYRRISIEFDELAGRFARAAKLADPDADSDAMVRAGAAARTAWFDAAEVAAELDEQLRVLVAAARLAGAPDVEDAAELEIALSVDTGKLHRRRVWEAWASTTGRRCGRWSALLAVGAKFGAAKHPEKGAPFRAPRPLESRWVPGKYGGYEVQTTDPEDSNSKAGSLADQDDWSLA